MSSEELPPGPESIDLVYTWVDGAHPGYPELLAKYSEKPQDRNPNRYRDNVDILKFSLRSIERFAPWVRRVFLVTTRPQIPGWLDTEAEGLHVVHHDEFFSPEHLPTFNSFAIVCNLHKIPGLSRHFWYMEDDRLLGRSVEPSDFMTQGGKIKVYAKFESSDPASRLQEEGLSPWEAALAYSNHLLDANYGPAKRATIKHAPLFFDRDSFEDMGREWRDAIERTSASRFRSPNNVAPEHLYPYYLLAESRAVQVSKLQAFRDTSYLGLENVSLVTGTGLLHLRVRRPKFYCLNDNFGEQPNPRCIRLVERFLHASYPEPSRFEKRGATSGF